jgi:hypothetical protein
MHPPAHAVVLSIDEKSQIQVLDRTLRAYREGRPLHNVIDWQRGY